MHLQQTFLQHDIVLFYVFVVFELRHAYTAQALRRFRSDGASQCVLFCCLIVVFVLSLFLRFLLRVSFVLTQLTRNV